MIKAKFMKWQADPLRETPLKPHELGESGLAELKRNIVISVVSLAICSLTILLLIRSITGEFNPDVGDGLSMLIVFGLFVSLLVASKLLADSTDIVMESGLYWRISVDDKLQNEWENAQKHKAQSVSFEWLMWGLVGACVFWILLRIIEALSGWTLLVMPSFGVGVVIAITGLYALSLLPLIYTCSTLEPISDEGLAELLVERKAEEIEDTPVDTPEVPLTGKQKWMKRIGDVSPYVVGIVIAIFFFGREGTLLYEVGYHFGEWLGKLFS